MKMEPFNEFDNPDAIFWRETNLIYGDWTSGPEGDGSRAKSISFPTPEILQRNGSIYLHVFLFKQGQSHLPSSPKYGGKEVKIIELIFHNTNFRLFIQVSN